MGENPKNKLPKPTSSKVKIFEAYKQVSRTTAKFSATPFSCSAEPSKKKVFWEASL
jgi:hypothetical protein